MGRFIYDLFESCASLLVGGRFHLLFLTLRSLFLRSLTLINLNIQKLRIRNLMIT